MSVWTTIRRGAFKCPHCDYRSWHRKRVQPTKTHAITQDGISVSAAIHQKIVRSR